MSGKIEKGRLIAAFIGAWEKYGDGSPYGSKLPYAVFDSQGRLWKYSSTGYGLDYPPSPSWEEFRWIAEAEGYRFAICLKEIPTSREGWEEVVAEISAVAEASRICCRCGRCCQKAPLLLPEEQETFPLIETGKPCPYFRQEEPPVFYQVGLYNSGQTREGRIVFTEHVDETRGYYHRGGVCTIHPDKPLECRLWVCVILHPELVRAFHRWVEAAVKASK